GRGRALPDILDAFRLDATLRRQRIAYGGDRREIGDDVRQRFRADVPRHAIANAIGSGKSGPGRGVGLGALAKLIVTETKICRAVSLDFHDEFGRVGGAVEEVAFRLPRGGVAVELARQ